MEVEEGGEGTFRTTPPPPPTPTQTFSRHPTSLPPTSQIVTSTRLRQIVPRPAQAQPSNQLAPNVGPSNQVAATGVNVAQSERIPYRFNFFF